MRASLERAGDTVICFGQNSESPTSASSSQVRLAGNPRNPAVLRDGITSSKPDGAIVCVEFSGRSQSRIPSEDLVRVVDFDYLSQIFKTISAAAPSAKAVFTSSALFYKRAGNYKQEGRPVMYNENNQLDDSTNAAKAVIQFEALVQSQVRAGADASIARLGGLYAKEGVFGRAILMPILEKQKLLLPDPGERFCCPIYVEDGARAILYLLERASAGEVYNVVDDEPVTLKGLVQIAADIFGSTPPVAIPYFAAKYLSPRAYEAVADFLPNAAPVSNEKLRKFEFDFAFSDARAGLSRIKELCEGNNSEPAEAATNHKSA